MKRVLKIFPAGAALILFFGFFSLAGAQKLERQLTLYATVTNKSGDPIGGLAAQQFQLFEGKMEKQILSFSDKAEPMSIGILIDLSSSMTDVINDKRGKFLPLINEGFINFIDNSAPDNEYFVATFHTKINVLQEPTKNHEDVKMALENKADFKQGGREASGTKLYDAIYAALNKITQGRHGKKALIIATDGMDSSSSHSFTEVMQAAGFSDTLIYFINISSRPAGNHINSFGIVGEIFMAEISRVSGGRTYKAAYKTGDEDSLKKIPETRNVFSLLAAELQKQYAIKFAPAPAGRKNEWRNIRLKLDLPKDQAKGPGKLSVRTREKYVSIAGEAAGGQN